METLTSAFVALLIEAPTFEKAPERGQYFYRLDFQSRQEPEQKYHFTHKGNFE